MKYFKKKAENNTQENNTPENNNNLVDRSITNYYGCPIFYIDYTFQGVQNISDLFCTDNVLDTDNILNNKL